jgi:predicted flap endonuclease-1-like 5' DNA nuclease
MTSIGEIVSVGDANAEKLIRAGVPTVEVLLRLGGSSSGRKSFADSTGIQASRILAWVNRADLMRVHGVGADYAELLGRSGVDSVKELAMRRPENLHARLTQVNEAENIVRRGPTQAEVAKWIAEARTLRGAVTH